MTDTVDHGGADEAVRTHVARAFGFEDTPETVEALWERIVAAFADNLDRRLTLADLCETDESPHRAIVDGETRQYQCVTDAFVLGAVVDDPVTVRTESPVTGTELIVEFVENDVVSAPTDAVLSFGVERSVTAPAGRVTPEKMYGRLCPYSNAFASRSEYERWNTNHPDVASVAHSLDAALERQARVFGNAPVGTDRSEPAGETVACFCCSGQ